jgi:hypothetical protein
VNAALQPNAITTNQRTESLTFGTALAPTQSSDGTAMFIYGSGGNVGEAQRGSIEFWPKTGLPRSGLVGTLEASITFNSAYRIVSTITWLESATAITSLRIKANVAGGIKAGSVLTLYKVSPTGGGGGASVADIFYKDFFSQAGMLPANIYKEEIYTFPARDFEVNNGPGGAPTHQLLQSRDRIDATGNTDYRFGWDTGALRDRMLFILGGLRCRGFSVGIALAQLTTSADIQLFDEPFGANGITFITPVGSDNSADYFEASDTRNREFSLAIYMERGTGIVRGFVKFGAEQWWPIGSVAGDPGQMRYAIIRLVPAGTERYNAVCPLIIRYE